MRNHRGEEVFVCCGGGVKGGIYEDLKTQDWESRASDNEQLE